EYRRAQAKTHLSQGISYWMDPDFDSLRSQMRAVYSASSTERQRKINAARTYVEERFTWKLVAERHWQACTHSLAQTGKVASLKVNRAERKRIGFITSWNTRCGIAEYSRYLITNLPVDCEPVVFA